MTPPLPWTSPERELEHAIDHFLDRKPPSAGGPEHWERLLDDQENAARQGCLAALQPRGPGWREALPPLERSQAVDLYNRVARADIDAAFRLGSCVVSLDLRSQPQIDGVGPAGVYSSVHLTGDAWSSTLKTAFRRNRGSSLPDNRLKYILLGLEELGKRGRPAPSWMLPHGLPRTHPQLSSVNLTALQAPPAGSLASRLRAGEGNAEIQRRVSHSDHVEGL